MKPKFLTLWSALAVLAVASACGDEKHPTTPSSASNTTSESTTSSTGGVSGTQGVSSTSPTPVSPADGAQIKNVNQPVTLVITNSVATSSAAPAYGFEVSPASDPGFTNKAFTKEGVAPGDNGQTSLKIDKLPAGQNYIWRAHLTVGGSAGPNSKLRGFTIGPQVTLTTPAPAGPANGSTVSGAPALTTNSVGKGGPAGPVSYQFDLSDSSSFGRILFTATVPEQGGQTSVPVPLSVIPASGNVSLYWRVQASDPENGVTTPFSSTFSFVYQPFDVTQVTMVDSPYDFPYWTENSKITTIRITGQAFEVDFDRRVDQNGVPRYGDVGFGAGSLQYTLGGCFKPNDRWYCSAVVQFWYGRELTASTPPYYIGRNWFYDSRWGPLIGYQPQPGELVGLFICPGNCRDVTDGSRSIAKERSNIALVPWSFGDPPVTYTYVGGTYVSSANRRVIGLRR